MKKDRYPCIGAVLQQIHYALRPYFGYGTIFKLRVDPLRRPGARDVFRALYIEDQLPEGVQLDDDKDAVRARLALDGLLRLAIQNVKGSIVMPRYYYSIVIPHDHRFVPAFIMAWDGREGGTFRSLGAVGRFCFKHMNPDQIEKSLDEFYRAVWQFMLESEGLATIEQAVHRAAQEQERI